MWRCEVKERAIIFSGGMVRAILEGRKTQTRRVVKWPVSISDHGVSHSPMVMRGGIWWKPEEICSYGRPGDRLWVRESFNWSADDELLLGENHRKCPERAGWRADNVVWRADGERQHPEWGTARWRTSIHLPRWASRITLEVVRVRVERVQEITPTDAIAEGCVWFGKYDHPIRGGIPSLLEQRTPVQEFAKIWTEINAKRGWGWEVNPWVWVVEFRKMPTTNGKRINEWVGGAR